MIQVEVKNALMKESHIFGPYVSLVHEGYIGMQGIKEDGTKESVWSNSIEYGGSCDTCASEDPTYEFPALPPQIREMPCSMWDINITVV